MRKGNVFRALTTRVALILGAVVLLGSTYGQGAIEFDPLKSLGYDLDSPPAKEEPAKPPPKKFTGFDDEPIFPDLGSKVAPAKNPTPAKRTGPIDRTKREGDNWAKIEGCTYLDNDFNDGDSFHVLLPDGSRIIVRLMSGDTPETEMGRFPDRVRDQAEYFGCTTKQAMSVGVKAKQFTHRELAGKSLTLYTRWSNARGASSLPRYFCTVVYDDGEQLLYNLTGEGFIRLNARAWGTFCAPSAKVDADLRRLQEKAKRAKKGGWE